MAVATTTATVTTSCKKYLDVSSELSQNLNIDEVFENAGYTKRWHANIFNSIIEYSRNASTAGPMSNPWSAISGEMVANFARNIMVTGYTPANTGYNRWATQYTYIRQALIFLQRAHEIPGVGNTSLPQQEVDRMRDEAKFFIAYAYFTLLELYGPVPLITELADPEDTNLDFPRAPMDDVINYIDSMLGEVIDSNILPSTVKTTSGYNNDVARPTIVTARALRAKLWVYASSKLFNGGFTESLSITNNDGTRLFPDYNPEKIQKAKTYLEDFLTYAHAQGHKLHVEYYLKPGTNEPDLTLPNPHESVYQVFQKYNDEILWASPDNEYSNPNAQERRSNPVDVYASPTNFANIGVSQESVDAFFMNNGLSKWDQGSGYKEDGFTTVNNPTHVKNHGDANIFNMYANREPRFYATVGYNGKSWHLHANEHNKTDDSGVYRQWFGRGKSSGGQISADNTPRAGYLLYKFKHRRIAQGFSSINVPGAPGTPFTVYTAWSRPSILLRLADFYLYYAEVLNEIDPNDPRIIEYIDKVRERAGIPGYAELASTGIKNIKGNKEAQFKAIVQERHVELLGEGQRWFDMRRWMIADPVAANNPNQGGVDGDMTRMSGMNMSGYDNVEQTIGGTKTTVKPLGDPDSFYKRTVLENRVWHKEYYWYPVPEAEINKSRGKLLVQNPLWPAVVGVSPAPGAE